jgi:intracellular multiplication protein IcmV
MKNQNKSRTGSLIKKIFNIRWWIDYDRLHGFAAYISETAKKYLVPKSKSEGESFNTAIKRLHLTENDLLKKQKALWRLSLLMLIIAFFLFTYVGYLLFYGTIKALIVSFVVMCMALILAFRYHFWYFQIKERKLGCTLKEWYQFLLGGKR